MTAFLGSFILILTLLRVSRVQSLLLTTSDSNGGMFAWNIPQRSANVCVYVQVFSSPRRSAFPSFVDSHGVIALNMF